MSKIFPIGKRPRQPFSHQQSFLGIYDELGYYQHHIKTIISNFPYNLSSKYSPEYLICGVSYHQLRKEHPIIQRFFRNLRLRILAKENNPFYSLKLKQPCSNQHQKFQKDALPFNPKKTLSGKKTARLKRLEKRLLKQKEKHTLYVPPCSQFLLKDRSLLFWALNFSDWEMMDALLKAGFDPNLKSEHGLSAMEYLFHISTYLTLSGIPESTIWLMFEKGGLLNSSKPIPDFIQRIYEQVQTKIQLQKINHSNCDLPRKITRI